MLINVSIIIVNYNTCDLLAKCLTSIDNCRDEADIEAIVVDNASNDNSADYVEQNHKNVKLIKNTINKGFSAANNQGAAIANGKYILFLNSDTVLIKGAIKGLLDVFEKHPHTGLCAPKLLNSDLTTQANVYHFPTFRAMFSRYTVLKYLGLFKKARNHYKMRGFTYDKIAVIDRPMGAAMMGQKNVLDSVGQMDERFFFYFEDVDLCKKIKDLGREVYFTPHSKIIHHGQGSSEKLGSAKTTAMFFKSMFYYFRKHTGKGQTFLFGLVFKPTTLTYLLSEAIIGVLKFTGYVLTNNKKARTSLAQSKQDLLFILKYGLGFLFY